MINTGLQEPVLKAFGIQSRFNRWRFCDSRHTGLKAGVNEKFLGFKLAHWLESGAGPFVTNRAEIIAVLIFR